MNSSVDKIRKIRPVRAFGALGLMVAVIAFATGCGGNDTPDRTVASGPANGGAAPSASASFDRGNPVAFAQCMRANGVENFPDPNQDGSNRLEGGGKSGGIDPDSPEFKNASEKCKQHMGTGVQAEENPTEPWSADKKLEYAKCMRENGLPNFPDPDASGRFPQLGAGSQIDPESPQFKDADKACAKYKPQGDRGGAPGGGGGS